MFDLLSAVVHETSILTCFAIAEIFWFQVGANHGGMASSATFLQKLVSENVLMY